MSALPLIGIIMGSDSDLPVMEKAAAQLVALELPFEMTVVSAHRTPERMVDYAKAAADRGLKVIIAGAGGGAPARDGCCAHDLARDWGTGEHHGPRRAGRTPQHCPNACRHSRGYRRH